MPQPYRVTEAATLTTTDPTGARIAVQIATPGWGSSGYYSPAVLAEAATSKVFKAGTRMFLDHPAAGDEGRPERSVRDLAGVLTSDATVDPATGGLVAEAKVYSTFRPLITELADDIGVSMRAAGVAESGEAEGRRGRIIEALTHAESVDFVTAPGRGGRVLALLESARGPAAEPLTPSTSVPTTPIPVVASAPATPIKEHRMPEFTEAEVTSLREAASRLTAVEAERDTAANDRDKAIQERDQAVAAVRLFNAREAARPIVGAALDGSDLTDTTRTRLTESLLSALPTKEDGDLDDAAFTETVKKAVEQAVAELAPYRQVSESGRVRDLGTRPLTDLTEADREYAALFPPTAPFNTTQEA